MSNSVRPHPWDSPGKNTGVGCHFLLQCIKVKSESEVTQSCPTLCNPMDCSLPGSSVHGIFQARVPEWGAIAFSDGKLGTREIVCLTVLTKPNFYLYGMALLGRKARNNLGSIPTTKWNQQNERSLPIHSRDFSLGTLDIVSQLIL